MTKTLTRLFDDYSDAKSALNDLERLGVPHDSISIVANNADGAHGDHDTSLDDVNDRGDVSRGVSTGAAVGGVDTLAADQQAVRGGDEVACGVGECLGGGGGHAGNRIVGEVRSRRPKAEAEPRRC